MAKPNFILPNKPAIKAGSILSYNYTDDLKFAAEPLDFSRNSSATRVNEQGLIEEVGYFGPQLVQNGDFSQEGPELVTNGDFSSDTDWAKGTGWSISGGTANCDGTQTGNTNLNNSSNNGIVNNKFYKIVYTISNYVSGSIRIKAGNTGYGVYHSSNGTYTQYIKAQVSTFPYAQFNADADFIGSIDNVSVKEVGQDWTLGTDWGIGNNKAIRTGIASSVLTQSGTFSSGKKFKLNFTITDWTTGNLQGYFYGGGGSDAFFNISNIGNGTFTFETTTTTNRTNIAFYAFGGFDGSVSNVSVIEVLGDKPRIDYSDSSTEPSLLLEPQSTNLVPYSEDFSNASWVKSGLSVTDNTIISPDGTLNAAKLVEANQSGGKNMTGISFSASTTNTFSVYAKASEREWIIVYFNGGGNGGYYFDVKNGVIGAKVGSNTGTPLIEDAGNGWYRCSITHLSSSSSNVQLYIAQADNVFSYQGDGTSGLYTWGAQLEQLSYATSYIPTSGSTATRLGETANNAGGAGVFNSEEGVLYAEIASLTDFSGSISINDGTVSNRIELGFTSLSRAIIYMEVGGVLQVYERPAVSDITSFYKIAFKWKLNDFSLHINGNKVAASSNGVTPSASTFNNLSFNGFYSNNFFGKTKNIQVFNYALTDEELQTLTT